MTIENGKFGERFREIGERNGKVNPVKFDWTKGESIELDKVESAMAEGAKAVTLVHNDTSVGIKNPAKEICGDEGIVVAAAISPDGKYIAAIESPARLDDGTVIGEYKVHILI